MSRIKKLNKIVLPGCVGIVGQNPGAWLKANICTNIVVLDKHKADLAVLNFIRL
jgi:hypothetical protein